MVQMSGGSHHTHDPGPSPAGGRTQNGSATTDRRAWCVLLRPRGMSAPADLIAALKRRAAGLTECDDPHAAMAELCRRASPGRDAKPTHLILTLVEPARILGLDDLRAAIDAYAPGVATWVYDHTANPRLRAAEPRVTSTRRPPPRPPARPTDTPSLRLTGSAAIEAKPAQASPAPADPTPSSPPRTTSAADLLSDEELSMLLSPPRRPAGRDERVGGSTRPNERLDERTDGGAER